MCEYILFKRDHLMKLPLHIKKCLYCTVLYIAWIQYDLHYKLGVFCSYGLCVTNWSVVSWTKLVERSKLRLDESQLLPRWQNSCSLLWKLFVCFHGNNCSWVEELVVVVHCGHWGNRMPALFMPAKKIYIYIWKNILAHLSKISR